MKQVFYKGLLALTIAFGMTSCDKNEGESNLQMTQSEVKAGLASKVTFSQDGIGIVVPKLKGSESSKTHANFSHFYSPAQQVLSITLGEMEKYSGMYDANDISTINPASILLENGLGYVATSSNVSNTGLGVVSSFLPYTSTVGFDLSESRSIVLAATLERGFLIVNGEAEADDDNRISGATANGVALIKDNDGDFYGYLLAGNHDIIISYLHNGVAATTEVSMDIAIGTAYTVETGLLDEAPEVSTRSVTATETANEAEIGTEAAGRDINLDGDMLDDLSRTVVTIFTTTGGTEDDGVAQVPSAWSIVLDNSEVTTGQTGTDVTDAAAAAQAELDRIAAEEAAAAQAIIDAAAQAEVDRLAAEQAAADAAALAAQVEADRVAAEEAAAAALLAATPDTYTYSDWSGTAPAAQTENGAWSPLTAESSVATISQSRSAVSVVASYDETRTATIQVNGDVDSPVPATDPLTRSVPETRSPLADETRDIANTAFIPPSTDNGGSDEAATGTLTVTEVRATLGGFGNTYTISSANGATVTAGDDVVITWGGTADGTVHTISITEDDLSDGAVVITVDRDFVTSTKS